MISRRDTYLMALARSATLDIQRNQMGCAALVNTGLSVTDRIRETEDRLRLMLRDSREGIWPTLPTIFDAMAYLASLAQIVEHGSTLDVASGDEGQ
jgi:hypothetical protein